jgi:hypothetical protein
VTKGDDILGMDMLSVIRRPERRALAEINQTPKTSQVVPEG